MFSLSILQQAVGFRYISVKQAYICRTRILFRFGGNIGIFRTFGNTRFPWQHYKGTTASSLNNIWANHSSPSAAFIRVECFSVHLEDI
jgi:hypothetical protein